MSDAPVVPQKPAQPTLQDHVHSQKQALVAKAQEMVNVSHSIIDSWTQNFVVSEKVKTRRTEQVNFLLGFVNQIANEGLAQLNALGTETKDPELSNKILDCNNSLMTAARNALNNIQQQEAAFQEEVKKLMNPQQANGTSTPAPAEKKTEVKVTEA